MFNSSLPYNCTDILKHSSQFKVIIVVKYLGYHQGLCCCTLQMAWLHSQMSAPVLLPKSPSTDFSPHFVPRKKTVCSQFHWFSFLPPQACGMARAVRSPAYSPLASPYLQVDPDTVSHSFARDLSQGDTSNLITSCYRERGKMRGKFG